MQAESFSRPEKSKSIIFQRVKNLNAVSSRGVPPTTFCSHSEPMLLDFIISAVHIRVYLNCFSSYVFCRCWIFLEAFACKWSRKYFSSVNRMVNLSDSEAKPNLSCFLYSVLIPLSAWTNFCLHAEICLSDFCFYSPLGCGFCLSYVLRVQKDEKHC